MYEHDSTNEKIGEKSAEEDGVSRNRSIPFHLYTVWLLTYSDLKTVVIPQTSAGVFSALASASMTTNPTPNLLQIMSRIPMVALWSWLSLLVIDIGNQRLPESILEDRINKPWRAMPTHRLSQLEARRFLLFVIPLELLLVYLCMGNALNEFVGLLLLAWLYNDLGGSEEHYIIRNLNNALAFICYASGSTLIAAGKEHRLTEHGQIWACIIGAIVFTTIQMQDLPDVEGDATRGRKSLPLALGDTVARWSIAIPVLSWSLIGPIFWNLRALAYLPTILVGGLMAFRVLAFRTVAADEKTWKLWCVWIILIYLLPLLADSSVFARFWRDLGAWFGVWYI